MKILALFVLITSLIGAVNADVVADFERWQASRSKPPAVVAAEANYIALCDEVFPGNKGEKQSLDRFLSLCENLTKSDTGLEVQLQSIVYGQRAVSALLTLQAEVARWAECPYPPALAWDYIGENK